MWYCRLLIALAAIDRESAAAAGAELIDGGRNARHDGWFAPLESLSRAAEAVGGELQQRLEPLER